MVTAVYILIGDKVHDRVISKTEADSNAITETTQETNASRTRGPWTGMFCVVLNL